MEKNRNVRMGFKSRQAYSRTDVNLPNNSPKIFKGKMRLFTYYTSKVFSHRRNNQEMDISKQKEKKKKTLIPLPQNTRGSCLIYILTDLFLF